jgi:hypothetical protein
MFAAKALQGGEGAEIGVLSEPGIEFGHQSLGEVKGPLSLQTLRRQNAYWIKTAQLCHRGILPGDYLFGELIRGAD